MSRLLRLRICTLSFILFFPAGTSAQRKDWSTQPLQSERSRTYDALHYRIAIRLDLGQKSFAGETTITLTSLRDRLDEIVLDAEEYKVTKVLSDWGESLDFKQSEKELAVYLPRPLKRGDTKSFTCTYLGRDPKAGLRFTDQTKDIPRLVFSDSWPNRVHHWFPCFDYPNDKVTHELLVTVPSPLKVAANGRLVSVMEDQSAGTATYHWSQDLPHSTYLIFFAAGPYVVIRDSLGTLPVNYWVYPQDENKVVPTYGKTTKMVEFFNRTFGYDYPWQKYDQISVPSGGGAESTSATAMTDRIMVDEKHEPEFSAIRLVSHELAHQWWGDLITLRSWAHTWVNESFATYSDYLYLRYEKGEEEGALNLQGKLAAYLHEAQTRYVRPIVSDRYEQPGDMFDAHTYPKGALVLHMLRNLLGDTAFFDTLKHFLHRFAFDVVDTGDFMRSVKTVTGQNLDWFFDQWLFKPGHPVFDVRSDWVPARKVITLRVVQVQDFSLGIPVFQVPVTVAVVTPAGKSITTIWLRRREEIFEFPSESMPLLVRFDEGNILLKELHFPKDQEELFYQLRNDDVIGRMSAANDLLRFKDDPKTIDALAVAAQKDSFWAVRQNAVESLGKQADQQILTLKKTAIDTHPSVRISSLAILGSRKDPNLTGFFLERFAKDGSDAVRAESLRAIGKARDLSTIPFLEKCAEVPSYRNLIAAAAKQAIESIRKQ
jgi:aminopeptidase N